MYRLLIVGLVDAPVNTVVYELLFKVVLIQEDYERLWLWY